MKVLIWVLCLFANAMITTIAKENGVILGAIPTVILYALAATLAQSLCGVWDKYKQKKMAEQNVPEQKEQLTTLNTVDQVQYCRKCGEKLIVNSQFCRKCGTEIIEKS